MSRHLDREADRLQEVGLSFPEIAHGAENVAATGVSLGMGRIELDCLIESADSAISLA